MENENVKLLNVKLYYPSLFDKEQYKGTPTEYFGTKLILDPADNKAAFEIVNAEIAKQVKALKLAKLPMDKACWKESENIDLAGLWELRAKTKFQPTIVDQGRQDVEKESGLIYSGCVVNVIVSFWSSANTPGGKRVGCTLLGVQFVKHGEPLGGGRKISRDVFDEIAVESTNDF
tara:strand:+ start:1282 stop:1806 length:525 start_codon:yes stop_codon:yes gene_type:complete